MMYPVKEAIEDYTALGGIGMYWLITAIAYFIEPIIAYRLAIAFVFIYVVTISIRLSYYKPRPNPRPYTNLIERIDASSFPSTHATRVMTLAYLLFPLLPLPAGILLIIAGLGVCVTRIIMRKHDVWDVLAGAIIAGIIAYLAGMMFPWP